MNCNECIEQLDSYVDRELSEQDLRELTVHLERCPPCEGAFELRSDLKRLVRASCNDGQAPAELRTRLAELLR